MQKSIFTKYFTVCATMIIISITILGAIFLVFASQYFKEDKYELLKANAQRAAAITQERFVIKGLVETNATSDLLRAMALTIDATFFLTTTGGKTVLCTHNEPCIHTENGVPVNIMTSIHADGEYAEMGKLGGMYATPTYTVGVPLINQDGEKIAYMFTSMHASKQLQNFLAEILKMFLISAIVVLVFTFIITYFVSLQMVKPLRQMALAAQRFGNGEFSTRLSVSSYDETGQLATALNNMAQSLSTVETMRRSFVANISHELKTPMTSIAGFIDGILDGTIPPEKERHYLSIVSDEVKRLARLVKTMLNLSKIEAGEMQITLTKINIVDIICQTVFSFEQQIDRKKLTIKGLDNPAVIVDADSDLIHQVVYNLTENAVKFVDEGGYIEFSFKTEGLKTYISIKNSGEGLSKEEIPKIFERFYKTDKSRGLDKNGVGLGLYIVRSIVGLHGGDINVTSVEGEYSEFTFSVAGSKPPSKLPVMFKKS